MGLPSVQNLLIEEIFLVKPLLKILKTIKTPLSDTIHCQGLPNDLVLAGICYSPGRASNTFITSSPRWLMTLTAMRPDSGRSNGRVVNRTCRVDPSGL